MKTAPSAAPPLETDYTYGLAVSILLLASFVASVALLIAVVS